MLRRHTSRHSLATFRLARPPQGICIALFSAIAMNFGVNMQKLSFIYELRKVSAQQLQGQCLWPHAAKPRPPTKFVASRRPTRDAAEASHCPELPRRFLPQSARPCPAHLVALSEPLRVLFFHASSLCPSQPPQERSPYWFQARWWIGMGFVIAAALGNFAAFALAPQVRAAVAADALHLCHARSCPVTHAPGTPPRSPSSPPSEL